MPESFRSICLQCVMISAACFAGAALAAPARAAAPNPPKGFTAIFNGKDLSGWWGATTEDPRKYLAMTPAQFKVKHDASLPDIHKHWRVEDGILINDGHGLYLTTDKNYRDFELLIDYKTVPLADSGIYLKGCPQVQIWDHTNKAEFHNGAKRLRRLVEQFPRSAGQGSARAR